MSRSQPAAPRYLHGAIKAVEGVLREHYPEPMTAREVSEALVASGYRWPLRGGWQPGSGWRDYNQRGEPTVARVSRVCEMRGGRTVISSEGWRGRARLYSIYQWAM